MRRLFVAIGLPEEIRQALSGVAYGIPGARWVTPENMHITLRFVGEVSDEQAERLRDELVKIDATAFSLRLNGLGQFLNGRKPQTLWAGVADSAPLSALQHDVEKATLAAGIMIPKQQFHAHVTIARLRDVRMPRLREYLTELGDFQSDSFTVEAFELVSSVLRPDGPIYSIEESFPLRAGSAA